MISARPGRLKNGVSRHIKQVFLNMQESIVFDRWNCSWAKTWAYNVFKQHHTQLNDFYWVNRSASNMALHSARAAPNDAQALSVFSLLPEDKRRLNFDIEKWTSVYKEHLNWVRLSSAVSLFSYLEIYLRNVVVLALESDPAVLLGASKDIDGAKLLKNRKKYSYSLYAEPIVKGAWQNRINKYNEYFGHVPPVLKDSLSELDHLRNLRNGVGHVFGRDINSYKTRINPGIQKLQRLSENRLKNWLGLVEAVALSVDEHLRTRHIGNYELIGLYHDWDKKYDHGRLAEGRAFKEMVGDLMGSAPGIDCITEMMDYYNSL
jgi:hypothetical protein